MATERKAHRIAVISGKGGVGKSVITANLAAALSAFGRKILVVDADLGLANLDVILGITPRYTLHDAFHGKQPLDRVVLPTRNGFDLIPAGSGLTEGSRLTDSMAEQIQEVLNSVEDRYEAILFDAGAGIGDVVMFFAGLADEILLVVTPEPTSLMDAYATIKILNQLQDRREFLLVVNQARPDRLNQVGKSIAEHLQKVISTYLKNRDDDSIQIRLIGSIPVDPAVPRAVMNRRLLTETSPLAPATCLMTNLASFLDSRM